MLTLAACSKKEETPSAVDASVVAANQVPETAPDTDLFYRRICQLLGI